MSNNIYDKNVSEKVIWEGSIPHDEATSNTSQPQVQEQPHMMFCYNCNNVIPGNSIYCPCCQVKLFTKCPKCGAKYSSQYPSCNQCGTNREEYLQMQRKERARIEARKREDRLRQEKLEREKQEQKRQEELRRYEQEAKDRKLRAEYEAENNRIVKTKEYEATYLLINELINKAETKFKVRDKLIYTVIIITCVILLLPTYFLVFIPYACIMTYMQLDEEDRKVHYIVNFILKENKQYKNIVTYFSIQDFIHGKPQELSKNIISDYRKKNGLPIRDI